MHNLALKAYGEVTSRTASDKQLEYALFLEITGSLKTIAQDDMPPPAAWADAIHRNLQFWTLIAVDMVNPENKLDTELKIRFVHLADQVRKLSHHVLAGEGDMQDLIEINETVMVGLAGPSADAGEEEAA